MRRTIILIFTYLIWGGSCREKSDEAGVVLNFKDEFETGKDSWAAGYTDYSTYTNPLTFEFDTAWSTLPSPLNVSKKALKVSGNNRSDDLFMFLKKRVHGLAPNMSYRIIFKLEIASNAPSNAVGVGGAPGEHVALKIGAVSFEPKPILNTSTNFISINLDKGNQSTSGPDMVAIGNIANGTSLQEYALIHRAGEVTASTDGGGSLWLIVGTDSGFEGKTELYYDSISVQIVHIV